MLYKEKRVRLCNSFCNQFLNFYLRGPAGGHGELFQPFCAPFDLCRRKLLWLAFGQPSKCLCCFVHGGTIRYAVMLCKKNRLICSQGSVGGSEALAKDSSLPPFSFLGDWLRRHQPPSTILMRKPYHTRNSPGGNAISCETAHLPLRNLTFWTAKLHILNILEMRTCISLIANITFWDFDHLQEIFCVFAFFFSFALLESKRILQRSGVAQAD